MRQIEMVTIAGTEVGARLRDADDRLARGQLLPCGSIIEVTLEIERRHARVVGIIEPKSRTQRPF